MGVGYARSPGTRLAKAAGSVPGERRRTARLNRTRATVVLDTFLPHSPDWQGESSSGGFITVAGDSPCSLAADGGWLPFPSDFRSRKFALQAIESLTYRRTD